MDKLKLICPCCGKRLDCEVWLDPMVCTFCGRSFPFIDGFLKYSTSTEAINRMRGEAEEITPMDWDSIFKETCENEMKIGSPSREFTDRMYLGEEEIYPEGSTPPSKK